MFPVAPPPLRQKPPFDSPHDPSNETTQSSGFARYQTSRNSPRNTTLLPLQSLDEWRRVATGVRESVAGPVRNGGKSWKKRGLCVTSRLDPFPTSPRWREGRISYESFLGSWHFPPSFSPLVSWPSPVTIIHLDRFETIRRVDLLPFLWALSRNNDQANKLPR